MRVHMTWGELRRAYLLLQQAVLGTDVGQQMVELLQVGVRLQLVIEIRGDALVDIGHGGWW